MTEQELIKRLRHGEGWPITAADRIEQLVKERDTAREYAGEVRIREKVADDARIEAEAKLAKALEERDEYKDAAAIWQEDFIQENQRLYEAKVKLAIAVEALRETTQVLSQCTFTIIRMKGQYFDRYEVIDKARAVLAELEGK